MIRFEGYRLYTCSVCNINCFGYRFNRNNIPTGYICLGHFFFSSLYIHDLNHICIFTVFFNRSTCKSNLNRTTPNLIIQFISICIQQIYIVRKGS